MSLIHLDADENWMDERITVKAAENVRRTVLLALLPVCVKSATILIQTCVSSVQHVKTTVHLTLFMLKCRKGEKYGNHYN